MSYKIKTDKKVFFVVLILLVSLISLTTTTANNGNSDDKVATKGPYQFLYSKDNQNTIYGCSIPPCTGGWNSSV